MSKVRFGQCSDDLCPRQQFVMVLVSVVLNVQSSRDSRFRNGPLALRPVVSPSSLLSTTVLNNRLQMCIGVVRKIKTAKVRSSKAKKGEKAAIRPLLRSASDVTCWTVQWQVPEHWTERAELGTQVCC